jgi:hypothetical protein
MNDNANRTVGPLDAIRELAKSNPEAATVVLCAVAVFAAVALIVGFGVDPQAQLPSALYVIGIGIVLLIATKIVFNQVLFNALSWFAAAVALAWIGGFVYFKADQERPLELRCVLYFWQSCTYTADAEGAKGAAALPAVPAARATSDSPPTEFKRSDYRILMQFAGSIDRKKSIIPLLLALRGTGWVVPEAEKGGERTSAAVGYNEVRYGEATDEPAADALARSVAQQRIGASTVKAVQSSGIDPGTLEIWISH